MEEGAMGSDRSQSLEGLPSHTQAAGSPRKGYPGALQDRQDNPTGAGIIFHFDILKLERLWDKETCQQHVDIEKKKVKA